MRKQRLPCGYFSLPLSPTKPQPLPPPPTPQTLPEYSDPHHSTSFHPPTCVLYPYCFRRLSVALPLEGQVSALTFHAAAGRENRHRQQKKVTCVEAAWSAVAAAAAAATESMTGGGIVTTSAAATTGRKGEDGERLATATAAAGGAAAAEAEASRRTRQLPIRPTAGGVAAAAAAAAAVPAAATTDAAAARSAHSVQQGRPLRGKGTPGEERRVCSIHHNHHPLPSSLCTTPCRPPLSCPSDLPLATSLSGLYFV